MAASADSEMINTFNQLKGKVVMAHQAKKQNTNSRVGLEKGVYHRKLMLSELSKMPDDVVLYKGVGKAFVLKCKPSVVSAYEDDLKATNEEFAKKKADRETIDKQVLSAEAELREYLESNPTLKQMLVNEVASS